MIQGFPTTPGQWGATSNISLAGGSANTELGLIEHGLTLRLRIPFQKAHHHDVWLNDRPVPPSQLEIWTGRGFSNVQISIPPAMTRTQDFFVVSVRYDPGEPRIHGLASLR